MIMGSHLSLAEPFRERDSFQVANAASAPNAGVHRLTGARHLPSRRRVTASWRSPGRTRGCIGSLAPSFCPAARVTASWRSPALVHLRARRVRRWCSIAWCLFGWSLVLLDLRAYGSIASRCYMSPIGRGTPSPAVFLISEAVRLSSSSFRCCPACGRVVPCLALQRVIVRRGTLQSGAFRLPVALVTRQIFGALLRSLGMGSALRCS